MWHHIQPAPSCSFLLCPFMALQDILTPFWGSKSFTSQMQSSSFPSSTLSALNLNGIESWEQRKGWHILMRQNVGLEQGKEAGERGHISIPGIRKEEKQRTISHGVRMNARSHQYLSLQLGATAGAHCSQGWDEASLKRGELCCSSGVKQPNNSGTSIISSPFSWGANSLIPTTLCTQPELLRFIWQISRFQL